MKSVNTHEAKTRFSELLAMVEGQCETVLIRRNGKPVAKLVPWQEESAVDPLRQHSAPSRVVFYEDPSLPLDDDDWPETAR